MRIQAAGVGAGTGRQRLLKQCLLRGGGDMTILKRECDEPDTRTLVN